MLLVVLVPKIVALKYVSTALGVHKSVSVLLTFRPLNILNPHSVNS